MKESAPASAGTDKEGIVPFVKALLRRSRLRAAMALISLVLLGMTEGVGIIMLIPFLRLAGIGETGDSPSGIVGLVEGLLRRGNLPLSLPVVLTVFVLLITFRALLQRLQSLLNSDIEHSFTRGLRNQLFAAVAGAEWLFITRRRASEITQILTAEIQRVSIATDRLLRMSGALVLILVHLLLAFLLSPPITALTLGCIILLLALIRPLNKKAQLAGEGMRSTLSGLYGAVMEHLAGVKIAKSFGVERQHIDDFEQLSGQVKEEFHGWSKVQANTRLILDIGGALALCAIFYFAVSSLRLPSLNLLMLIFLFARLLPKASLLQQHYQQLLNALPGFTAIGLLEEQCLNAAESKPPAALNTLPVAKELRIADVSFGYTDEKDEPFLRDVDITIAAGAMTAILGPSGAGKSTLADLILGLLQPDRGEIRVDGELLSGDCLHAWRRSVGYVPQETFLFHASIRENLLWARPESEPERLRRALAMAGAEGFVDRLPAGLDTVVGDRGVRLSGGERQRIALARALLREPSLLLLDEATSALDPGGEMKIQQAIAELRGKMTIVAIAHRLSTIRDADHIVLLEEGRVVENGERKALEADAASRFRALLALDGRGYR